MKVINNFLLDNLDNLGFSSLGFVLNFLKQLTQKCSEHLLLSFNKVFKFFTAHSVYLLVLTILLYFLLFYCIQTCKNGLFFVHH